MTHLGCCEFLIMFFRATSPSSPYNFDEPQTLLALSRLSRVLAMRALQAWALLHPDI